METQEIEHQGRDHRGRTVKAEIATPVGRWTNVFEAETLIAKVIAATLDHFAGQLEEASYELRRKGDAQRLDSSTTLANNGFEIEAALILVPEPGAGK